VNHKDWDMLIKQDISFGIVGRIEKRPEQRETIMVVAPADATSVMIAGPTQEQRDSVMIQVTLRTSAFVVSWSLSRAHCHAKN
jgi:hypothetical protein